MDQFKARPTIYKGIMMRSRLEARVAAWLDNIGVRWTYEVTAYAGPSGQYLPDFQLHIPASHVWRDRAVFLEIKGEAESAGAWTRAFRDSKKVLDSIPDAVLLIGYADDLERDGSVYAWNFGCRPDQDPERQEILGDAWGWTPLPLAWVLTRLGFLEMCEHWRLPRWNE